MSTFRKDSAAPRTPAGGSPTEESTGDLSSLLNYPALGRLFDGKGTESLEEMRGRLARTNQDLERVVRQGSKEDAERATRASRAVSVTLAFLEDLEQIQRGGGESGGAK